MDWRAGRAGRPCSDTVLIFRLGDHYIFLPLILSLVFGGRVGGQGG